MTITLNGKTSEIEEKSTLQTLVTQTARQPQHVVAEVNGIILERARWEETLLRDGDCIELVTFVGGG